MERYKKIAITMICVIIMGITAMATEKDLQYQEHNNVQNQELSNELEPPKDNETSPDSIEKQEPTEQSSEEPSAELNEGIESSPDASPSFEPLVEPVPSVSPSVKLRLRKPVQEIREIGLFNVNCVYPDLNWKKFGFKGSMYQYNGGRYSSYTAATQVTGATLSYNPGIVSAGMVNVYADIISSKSLKNDTNIKFEVYHNGKIDEIFININEEETGYKYLGTYDFAGIYSGKEEYVKVTRVSNDDSITMVSAVRFNVLQTYFQYDENTPPKLFYYTVPYGNGNRIVQYD